MSKNIQAKSKNQYQQPQCNSCEKLLEDERYTQVTQHWGYESIGKDFYCDEWSLCQKCEDNIFKDADIFCSFCKKTIVDVMAELAAASKNCIFYGDVATARKYYQEERHCGYEYAEIAGYTVCEVCYEKLVLSFKKPIVVDSDKMEGENTEADLKIDRIQRAFQQFEKDAQEQKIEDNVVAAMVADGFTKDEAEEALVPLLRIYPRDLNSIDKKIVDKYLQPLLDFWKLP